MLLEASQVEYEPFGKTPLKREIPGMHKCHLYSHSCRAKPLYALNFNMSEYMSDEHVLP